MATWCAWIRPGSRCHLLRGKYTLTASTYGASASITFCIVSCQAVAKVETGSNQSEPYIAITPTATLPFITLQPDMLTGTPTTTSVEFWVAPPYVNAGACTTLNWNVSGDFQAIYYEGTLVNASGNRTECPQESRNYQLQVVGVDGSTTEYWASVEVYQADEPTTIRMRTQSPTKTPTATVPPLTPADTSGPTINWTNLVFEDCKFFGQAGISDTSGVNWAQLYFNKNGAGWQSVWMSEISADFWQSEVGIDLGDGLGTPIGSLEYYIIASDSLGNQSESSTSTYDYTSCGG